MDWFVTAGGLEFFSEDGEYSRQREVEQWVADNDYEIATVPYRTMYRYNPKDVANTLRTLLEWIEQELELKPTIVMTTVEPFVPNTPKYSRDTTN
jgi:hypothetical protein